MRTRTRGSMTRSGREEQTTHLTPDTTGFEAEGGMSGCRPRYRAGGVRATLARQRRPQRRQRRPPAPRRSGRRPQYAHRSVFISVSIGFSTNLKPPALQGLRSQILATRSPPALLRKGERARAERRRSRRLRGVQAQIIGEKRQDERRRYGLG